MQLKSNQKKQPERLQNRQSRWTTTQTLSLGGEQDLFVLDMNASEPPDFLVEFLLAYAARPTKTYHFVFVLHTLQ